MNEKCILCSGNGQRGGSVASDSVVSLVSCTSFDQMSAHATNGFSGGGKKMPLKTKKLVKGGSCNTTVASASLVDSYSIGPATVPLSIASAPTSGVNMASVQASVLATLAAQPPQVHGTYQNIIYPDYFVDNNIKITSQMGGGAGCMCGGV